jgi:hypothetical protein
MARKEQVMAAPDKPIEAVHVSCETCLKKAPIAEALV